MGNKSLLMHLNKHTRDCGIRIYFQWETNPSTLAKNWLTFKQQLHDVFQLDGYTQVLVDRHGLVNDTNDIPWYTLKTAANYILSKLDSSVKCNISHVNENDPTAILSLLDILCSNITPTTQPQLKAIIYRQYVHKGETGLEFFSHMHTLFCKAHVHYIHFPKSAKIDIVLNGFQYAGNINSSF
jgi:predicted nuclease of predicted toxin-antitoxin system